MSIASFQWVLWALPANDWNWGWSGKPPELAIAVSSDSGPVWTFPSSFAVGYLFANVQSGGLLVPQASSPPAAWEVPCPHISSPGDLHPPRPLSVSEADRRDRATTSSQGHHLIRATGLGISDRNGDLGVRRIHVSLLSFLELCDECPYPHAVASH